MCAAPVASTNSATAKSRLPAWRGIGVRQVRLACGLVMFAYIFSHFFNHALGNISYPVMEWWLRFHIWWWRIPIVNYTLYTAATTHLALGLWALYRRRHFRYAAIEITQLVLGLSIPLLIASHFGAQRLAGAMRKARERTGAENYFVIFARNAESLAITGTVAPSNVFTIRTNSLWELALDTMAFLRWTRRNAIDTVIDLELFSRFTGLLSGLSGADRRVGFYRFNSEGLYRGDMLTHRVAYNPHIHMAKNFIALVNALLSEAPTTPYSKTFIDDDETTLPLRPASPTTRTAMNPAAPVLVAFHSQTSTNRPGCSV